MTHQVNSLHILELFRDSIDNINKIPDTSNGTRHRQDLCQSPRKLPKEHHQTSHSYCARIPFGRENIDFLLIPANNESMSDTFRKGSDKEV